MKLEIILARHNYLWMAGIKLKQRVEELERLLSELQDSPRKLDGSSFFSPTLTEDEASLFS